jgi:hypothetical protein
VAGGPSIGDDLGRGRSILESLIRTQTGYGYRLRFCGLEFD